jgi:hypothetical protein
MKKTVNNSEELIGIKLTSDSPITVNYRKGKQNVIICTDVEVVDANCTGRRLTCIFKSGKEVLGTRRIYKEHFARMADKFGVDVDIEEDYY